MSEPRPRRRSGAVRLALIGTAGGLAATLGGCSRAQLDRNVYNTMADCAADYSMSVCSTRGYQGSGKFYGPAYRVVNGRPSSCSVGDPGSGPSWNSRKIAVERAGFGSSCSSRSSGRWGLGG